MRSMCNPSNPVAEVTIEHAPYSNSIPLLLSASPTRPSRLWSRDAVQLLIDFRTRVLSQDSYLLFIGNLFVYPPIECECKVGTKNASGVRNAFLHS